MEICEYGSWCGRSGADENTAQRGQRVELPPTDYKVIKPRDDKGATTFKLESATRGKIARVNHPSPTHKPDERADVDATDQVYRALLEAMPLSDGR